MLPPFPNASMPRRPIPLTRSQAMVVWSALAAGAAFMNAATFAVAMPPNALLVTPMRALLAFLTVSELVAGPLVLRRIRATAARAVPDGLAGTQMIIGCALATGIALFAGVAHLVTQDPLTLAFLVPPAAAFLWLFPSTSRWDWYTAPGTGRTNRMVRG